jgi:hypothetical protein
MKTLKRTARTRFDCTQPSLWFNLLKKLTKYNNFAKRDGSLATCCIEDGKTLTGTKFAKAVATWYKKLCCKHPLHISAV